MLKSMTKLIKSITFVSKLKCLSVSLSVQSVSVSHVSLCLCLSVCLSQCLSVCLSLVTESLGSFKPNFTDAHLETFT